MQLCKVQRPDGYISPGLLESGQVTLLPSATLAELLHAPDPTAAVQMLLPHAASPLPLTEFELVAPVDAQEVWAAGVTYKRSQEARERESEGAGRFYDLVYTADRPELFFKATARRVVGPNGGVRIRKDATWSVPEPELALVVAPDLRIVGYTIGNDMSSRDIEGANPLYLPQAKVYAQSCALGPVVTLTPAMPHPEAVTISMRIERGERLAFEGSTPLTRMNRTPESLVAWLGRDNEFPDGVVLLTGTGIIPPDDFTLHSGDRIRISISGIGELVNTVL